jgi:amino acid transporter
MLDFESVLNTTEGDRFNGYTQTHNQENEVSVDGLIAPCVKAETEQHSLDRKVGLPEALGMSLSIVGPSMAMAFNVSLAVCAAGRAAPLAFAIGTVGLGMVALAFVKFSRRVAHAGSAYAYIGQAFGWRWGFLAGWTLLLTYLTYAAGATALIGNFLQAAVENYGVRLGGLWFVSSVSGLVLASFCAFGIDSTKELASANAPLNDLANRYVSRNFATAIDLAAAISAFSCVLGSLSAAARFLFALGRSGLASRIAAVHPVHGTPSAAVIVVGLLCLGGFALWAPLAGPGSYSGDLLTIGTLALVLVYMAVNAADLAESFEARRLSWSICGMAGFGVLLWSIYNSIYPAPAFPYNVWPYCVVVWILAGVALAINHPVLREKLGSR